MEENVKIVVLDGYAANPNDLSWAPLQALGELTVYDRTAPEEVEARIADAQLVLTNKVVIGKDMMDRKPNLRYIGVLATGYNVVDIKAAREHGIVVSNIPAYSTPSVAQHTLALLLELTTHVGAHNQAVQEGKWAACRDFCFWDYPLMELSGKTMGIIGYGRIGQNVEKVAEALGMKVLICSSHAKGENVVSLDTLFAQADVISLHCPLTEKNAGLIRRETISKMKDGVLILNTARGGLICEEDLREALLSGKVGGAAVDVASREPIQKDNPLLGLKNCILTPHIAWAPREARQRLMDIATENVRAFIEGKPVNNVAQ